MKVCVTGSAGFIMGYVVEELLRAGHQVIGVDNFSKYGEITRSYDNNPHYEFVRGDAKSIELMKQVLTDGDVLISGAAKIGGISYFHQFAYDLIAENERIVAAAFDAAIWAHRQSHLQRVVVVSSSMVFESATTFPTLEGAQLTSPPPVSSYGFQKLACEYFARGAWEQYQLPYTIVRPFNCVGIGESRALNAPEMLSGNVKLAMSHVVPDLVMKVLSGQRPLHLLGSGNQVRHYTYGGDVARGIRMAMESSRAINEDFNISTGQSTTVLQLAELIWRKINPGDKFSYVCDPPFPHDVQMRVPDVRKALNLLGFEARVSLDAVLDEVIPWIAEQMKLGRM
jgi:nucleoside-diphosphate-sugar epimerase